MALTDARLRNAKPREKAFKLFDGGGLYLEVAPSGGKWWRLKYRFGGKEKRISLGVYPGVGLKEARSRREAARQELAAGINPADARKAARSAGGGVATASFEAVAREWFARFAPSWAPSHARTIIRRLERDVFPWLGGTQLGEVDAPELLTVLRRIESRGAVETAHRVMQVCGQVFRYGVATGRVTRDPSQDLRGALAPVKARHYASVTDPKAVGELLRVIDGYRGSFVTKCALQLAPLVFVRPGELRHAEWAEVDLDAAEWRIPAEKMKMGGMHIVPLSRQAVELLRGLHPVTSGGRYVFPGARTAS